MPDTRLLYRPKLALFILTILIISGFSGLIPTEGAHIPDATKAPTRSGEMGNWTELPSGSWPSEIDTSGANIMYREAEKELVVFNRVGGYSPSFSVWSYFELNDTWVKWNTSGQLPDERYSNRAFTSNENNTIAYFYGGYRSGGGYTIYTLDIMDIFFYENMTWVQIDAPSSLGGRYDSGITFDRSTDSVWIFGGRDSNRVFQAGLFQYNSTYGWNHPTPIDQPSGRDRSLLTITTNGSALFLSLGRYRTQGYNSYYENDLWTFFTANSTWIEISNDLGIPTQAGALFQYRDATDDLILSMGYDGNDILEETYLLDPYNGFVQEVNLTGGMPPKDIQAWDLMSDGITVVIFGDDGGRKDIWSLDTDDLSTGTDAREPCMGRWVSLYGI